MILAIQYFSGNAWLVFGQLSKSLKSKENLKKMILNKFPEKYFFGKIVCKLWVNFWNLFILAINKLFTNWIACVIQ